MSLNGIAQLPTKEQRQHAKLDLVSLKRQGYTLNGDGTVASGPDTNAPFYRERNFDDVTELPTQYVGDAIVDNENPDGLIVGRPWIIAPAGAAGFLLEGGDGLLLEDGNPILTE